MTIEAGEGYRLLEADETIREGDEWVWDPRIGFDWQPESHSVGSTVATERARVAQIRAEEGPPLRGATLLYRRRVSPLVEVHTVPESAYVVVPPVAGRPPRPHRTDTLDLIHQEVSRLCAKLSAANYSAADAGERARRAERDLTGLRGVHQAIGEALIRVWPSEPRDWVRKVEAVGGEMAALRRETQALRDQVRCVGPETCGECLACVRSALTACKRERDEARGEVAGLRQMHEDACVAATDALIERNDAQANVDALDEEIVAACAVLPSSDQPESLADRCARVVAWAAKAESLIRERDESRLAHETMAATHSRLYSLVRDAVPDGAASLDALVQHVIRERDESRALIEATWQAYGPTKHARHWTTLDDAMAVLVQDHECVRRERDQAQVELERVTNQCDEARALLAVASRVTPPASVVEGLRGLAEREAAPASARELIANLRDDYESVLTLIDALDAADSEEERAVAIAELRAYARRPEDIAPVEVSGPGVPLGPTKPDPFIGETPVREWVIGREPPPAREVVAPAIALGLTEVGRG